MADEKDNKIYIPVDQQEQAQQKNANNLLARDVYERVSGLLHDSAQRVVKYEQQTSELSSDIESLNNCRSHDAILVDGDRGTGKSTVLVNIKVFLTEYLAKIKETNIGVDDYLWLKTIDPTVMENSDDLLLNTIVAALLSNEEFKKALHKNTENAEIVHKQLQDLSRSLEGTQTHRDKFGIDKLRSFMGNQSLAEQIHRLYCLATRITGKKLVVLPIDDVDTSLNLAFDNVEVIRKYLASPYVVPIVSGNLDLYHEVIWRNFHGRLTKDSKVIETSLIENAQELSRNYQQKVFPLYNQLRMPSIKEYFANDDIYFSCSNGKQPSLKLFYFWVESVVNQQTSAGLTNYLNIPVDSIRDLVQLTRICSKGIQELEFIGRLSKNMVHRLTIMPSLTAEVVDEFASDYGQAAEVIDVDDRRDKRKLAYQSLEQALLHDDLKKYRELAQDWQEKLSIRTARLLAWNRQLQEYLHHKPSGGQSYIVCLTNEFWLKLALAENDQRDVGYSVLNSSLFNPLDTQYNAQFDLKYENRFEHFHSNSSNINASNEKLSLFNFPIADSGKRTDKLRSIIENKWIENSKVNDVFDIFYSLTHHRATSDVNSRLDYWRIGRIFELLVMSLVKPLNMGDLKQLIGRAPFYCEASLLQQGKIIYDEYQSDIIDEDSMTLYKFVSNINEWRIMHFVQVPSSWLVHQLMIKVFEEVKSIYRGKDIESEQEFIQLCYRAFLMIVGVCGSVEKSNVFGLGQRVALIEIDEDLDKFRHSDLYNLNIRPFTELPKGTGSVTRSLFYHPIGRMLRQAIEYFKNPVENGELEKRELEKGETEDELIKEMENEKAPKDIVKEDIIHEKSEDSYSESSIDEELEADESLEDLNFGSFTPRSDMQAKDYGELKIRYTEEQLHNMAIVAGVVFYTTYSMFKGRSVSHGHIQALTKKDFARLDVQMFAKTMVDAGLPKDFVVIIFNEPKRFLSAKTNYRKLTTFLAKFNALKLTIDESALSDD